MDLTALWVLFQRHKKSLGFIITAIVIFGTGWQVGRVMSPYYASHPIVFEDHTTPTTAETGSGQALAALRETGVEQRTLAEAEPVATPTVAGVVSSVAPEPEPTGATDKLFVGSVNSDKYHHRDCPSVKQIKEENQVWFASVEEAEGAGYSPSKCTLDKLK